MNADLNLWLIPVLPLAGAAINGFLGKKSSRQAVTTVALSFSGAAFAMALWVAARFWSLSVPYQEFFAHWIRSVTNSRKKPGYPGVLRKRILAHTLKCPVRQNSQW
jgi:hypothetical protein